jgi:L-ascorbate metabolism protein UlaG (beta-lactamase superfamily)
MVITYFGNQYFRLTLGDLTIALNPSSKSSKAPRFGADVAIITSSHADYNNPDTVTLGDKEPFVVDGPGSYEIKNIFISGASSNVSIDKKEYINTVYGFELDGIKIAFLGSANNEKEFSSEAKEIAGDADMVFVAIKDDPVGAYKTAMSFESNMIIPMDYDKTTLARFLKEGGQDKAEVLDKATLKRKDLDGKEGHILVLASQE